MQGGKRALCRVDYSVQLPSRSSLMFSIHKYLLKGGAEMIQASLPVQILVKFHQMSVEGE